MNSSTLHQNTLYVQDARMAKVEQGLSLTQLLHNLIREHGQYKQNSFDVDVNSLPISDKRLLISHFESAEWYEYACQSHLHTETLFSEHKNYIQKVIDENCGEVYLETMEEMRSYK